MQYNFQMILFFSVLIYFFILYNVQHTILKLNSGVALFNFNISFEAYCNLSSYIVGVNMDHK